MKTILSFVCSLVLLFSASLALADEAVNLNAADVEQLAQLDGIGEVKAQAIVAWREENGEFVSVEQLAEVDGIGEATIDANRDAMTLE
ncbi:ComEA family DNA-binding protein [Marinimicrobium sp. C2-29]|uniref:ComEA family DNA-binding protein n=1 Tax=Marinimicrobium sp. C2-29 TaxID=3139825 RepID=UPI0031393347